jgi:hypothetical protein
MLTRNPRIGFRTYAGGKPPVPLSVRFTDNRKPIAIFPARTNPRILAQRGVFTVHGADEIALEDLASSTKPVKAVSAEF